MRKQKGFFIEEILMMLGIIVIFLLVTIVYSHSENQKSKQLSVKEVKSSKAVDAITKSKKEIIIKNVDSWNY